MYCVICGKYREFKEPKISHLLEKKTLVLSLFAVSEGIKMKKYLKKKNQWRY